MAELTPDELPLVMRLALSYAPARSRQPTLVMMLLDQRFAQFVSQAKEPILAQMRLAWWRDELAKHPDARAQGDSVLTAIGALWQGHELALSSLVDGWEELLAEPPLPETAPENFAVGRALCFAAIARMAGDGDSANDVLLAGRRWAMADLAAKISDPDEKAVVVDTALRLGKAAPRLPRSMRPLAVLDGLARSALEQGGGPLLQGRRSIARAMRLGLLGN